MYLAVILPSLANKGPVIVAQTIINHLPADKNLHVDVYYFDPIIELSFNCPCFRISMNDRIDFDKYDIIHLHTYRPVLYMYRNRKHFKGLSIVTLHNFLHRDLYFEYNFLTALIFTPLILFLLQQMDVLIAVNGTMKEYYRRLLIRKRIEVIPHGISPENKGPLNPRIVESISQLKKKGKLIGTSCLITHRKGLDQILHLLRHRSDLTFCIIGDGKSKGYLMNLSEKLAVSDRVLFTGYLRNATDYYPFFDFFTMPSRSEGFGLSLLEAASFKLPIITTDLPVFTEIFPEEIVRFRCDDLQDLLAKTDILIRRADELGEMAFRRYHDHYRAEIMARRYFDLYRQLTFRGTE